MMTKTNVDPTRKLIYLISDENIRLYTTTIFITLSTMSMSSFETFFGGYHEWVVLSFIIILAVVSLVNTSLLISLKVSQVRCQKSLSRTRKIPSEIYSEIIDVAPCTERSDSLHYQAMYQVKHHPVYSVPSRNPCSRSASMPTSNLSEYSSRTPTSDADIRNEIESRGALCEDVISISIED